MICPSCQADVPGTPKFCNKCGAPFAVVTAAAASAPAAAPTKVCPQCGTVNAAAARFCKKDGYNFAAAAETTGRRSTAANRRRRLLQRPLRHRFRAP